MVNCHRLRHCVFASNEALLDGLLLLLCLSLHLLCLDVCLLLHPLQLLQGDRVQREKLGFAQNKLRVAFLGLEKNHNENNCLVGGSVYDQSVLHLVN